MASPYKKVIHGRPYWYLREMGWVDGKPKMVSERYVGTAADIEALLDGREQAMVPERCRHLDFGAVAAVWGLLTDLKVADLIDEVAGAAPSGQPLSTGTYLALAVLNRVVDPCSKRGFADWWRTTAADRFTKIGVGALDHRRFWDAMHAVPLDGLAGTEERLALAVCARYGLDTSSVALDMTNFATFIDTGNDKAPIAQRGKAKQKRTDLRLVGLGLVVTRDGGSPARRAGRCGHRGHRHDGGLRRRAELAGELRAARRHQPALRGLGARQRLPRPAGPTRQRPHPGRPGPLRWPERLRHPPRHLRHRAAHHPHPFPAAAPTSGPRLHRHHPGQSRQATRRTGRHPGPRQDPPRPHRGRSRDRQDHPQRVGTARDHLAAR